MPALLLLGIMTGFLTIVFLIGSLSITVTIAALTAAIAGIPQASGNITPGILAAAFGLAILLPVLPFAFELLALRQMTPTAFGTLMALEPGVGVLLGLIVLRQEPSVVQLAGILLVVLAGASQRGGRRRPQRAAQAEAHPGQGWGEPLPAEQRACATNT